jgi:hypothetical protein
LLGCRNGWLIEHAWGISLRLIRLRKAVFENNYSLAVERAADGLIQINVETCLQQEYSKIAAK